MKFEFLLFERFTYNFETCGMKSSVMASKGKAQGKDKLTAFHNKFFFTSKKAYLTYARGFNFTGVFDLERMCLSLNQY